MPETNPGELADQRGMVRISEGAFATIDKVIVKLEAGSPST